MSIRSSDALRNMMKSADEDDNNNNNNNNNNDTASLPTMTPYTTDEIDETPCPITESTTTTTTSSAFQEESQNENIIPETASVRQPSRKRCVKGRRCFGSVERQLIKQLLASEIEACNVTFTTIKLACARRPDIINELITSTGFTEKELQSKIRDSARALYRRS